MPDTVRFPGIATTADGTGAVVWTETQVAQAACAYPITPTTMMGAGFQTSVANGATNLWGDKLTFVEAESEHSAATVCEGFALAGGRVTSFTSGQGLVLMKEVLYTIAGKRLPVIFHIGARALTSQALNVHAGHDDVMAVADTGWGMLVARNAQEAADFGLIARRAAEDCHTPFMSVQDGFLTTHTIESVRLPEAELMQEFLGPPAAKLLNLMDPANPVMSGVVQNQDAYMKGKLAQRAYYDALPGIVERAMAEYGDLTGRRYGLVDGYRMDDAELAIVAMGTLAESAMAAVDHVRKTTGTKVGVVTISCLRPFPGPQLVAALQHVRALAVVERLDIPTMQSNPLTAEVKAAFADAQTAAPGYPVVYRMPVIQSGVAGLGSRDVTPGDWLSVIANLEDNNGKRFFSLGIQHVTALQRSAEPDVRPPGTFAMRGHSVGGFGSVTTNKVIATIMADLFGLYVQAAPKYGSEKKGLPTNYYLTVSPEPIRTHNELQHVDFVPLNDANAFHLGNPLVGLQDGGMIFVQTTATTPAELWASIPDYAKAMIHDRHIRVLGLDTVAIAKDSASRADLIQRMQGIVLLGVFLRCAPFQQMQAQSEDVLFEAVKRSLWTYFGKRGERTVEDNLNAVRRGYHEVFEVPEAIIASDMAAIETGRRDHRVEMTATNAFFV
jgi:pyruvate-ferredoxin/flavodoxin oxidoreductase